MNLGERPASLTNCAEVTLEKGDCLTHAVVSGDEHVERLVFETKLNRQYVIGNTGGSLKRWSTVNKDGKCMTGIHGVYKLLANGGKSLKGIGFYFESPEASGTTGTSPTLANPNAVGATNTNV